MARCQVKTPDMGKKILNYYLKSTVLFFPFDLLVLWSIISTKVPIVKFLKISR